MSASIADTVRILFHQKGISEELVLQVVEDSLLAAYKKKFGTAENAVTKVNAETGEVHLYSKKEVVGILEDEVLEITLEEARERNPECELKDEVLVELRPSELGRIAAQTAKQIVNQRLKEIEKNVIYNEYRPKIGQLVTGYFQRSKNGHIFLDLGRVEAILPRYEQSTKEIFTIGERIKGIIIDVQNLRYNTQIVISRSDPLFVQRLIELDVPEILDKIIQIKSIVRHAGFRTKIAVFSQNIDPVGACVGMKGMRIQAIIKELEGEKIDVIRYSENIREYIANSLAPSQVKQVIILNEANKEALAVVDEEQLSLAIGKQGHNVKLAAKLTGWDINIKLKEQLTELDYANEPKTLAESLFSDEEENEEEIHSILEIHDLGKDLVQILHNSGIETLEELVDKKPENLIKIEGMTEENVNKIFSWIKENVVIMGEEEQEEKSANEKKLSSSEVKKIEDNSEEVPVSDDNEYIYSCPECSSEVQLGVSTCPGCGIELEFE